VTEVTAFAASLELRDVVQAADHTHARRTSIFLRLQDGGVEGWGECPVATAPGVDATAEDVLDGLTSIDDDALATLLADPSTALDPDPQRRASEPASGPGHRAARALVGGAALDLELRRAGRSLAEHLGVAQGDVGFSGVVGIEDAVGARDRATALVALGATRLRVKVSARSGTKALEAVLDTVDVPVVADANGSLDPRDTDRLDALTSLPIAWLEQPFAPGSLQQSARLARSSPVRIGLDESVVSTDALRVIALAGAASVVCVKPARLGVLGALEVLGAARELRLTTYVGGYFEAGLGRAALAVLATSGDLDGDVAAPSTYLLDDPCALEGPRAGRQPLYRGVGTGPLPRTDALVTCSERAL
jgi:o-succinylbenzoate synthase